MLKYLVSLFFVFSGFAAENAPVPPEVTPPKEEVMPSISYPKSVTRMTLSLIAVIVLLIITVWILKRIMKARALSANAMQAIKVLEKRVISPKTILYVVEANGEKVLISESQLEVRALKALSEMDSKNI